MGEWDILPLKTKMSTILMAKVVTFNFVVTQLIIQTVSSSEITTLQIDKHTAQVKSTFLCAYSNEI